jgi:hypothetical protein
MRKDEMKPMQFPLKWGCTSQWLPPSPITCTSDRTESPATVRRRHGATGDCPWVARLLGQPSASVLLVPTYEDASVQRYTDA